MKHSRLETVVRIRRLQERIARGEVLAARRAVTIADDERAAIVSLVEDIASAAPTGGRAFLAHRKLVEGGIGDVFAAGERVDETRRHAHRSLDRWHDAARRLDGVERLDERLTAVAEADEQRRVAIELDDLTVMRHGRGSVR